MSDTDDHVARLVMMRAEAIERDVVTALGWRTRLPKPIIKRLGFEVIYQRPPYNGPEQYRGIARRGVFVIDRHPDWPTAKETRP